MATYNFTVRAQDDTGAFSDRDFAIQVRNNLVDRLLAIDENDAYASIDGKTWTTRVGKGGHWCRNLLGKWLVVTEVHPLTHDTLANTGRVYRISDDTIDWTEGLEFKLSNDAPEYDAEGAETKSAGPLYGLEFSPTRDQITVINGKIIVPCIVNDKMCIVYSTDAVKWYVYQSERSSHASNMMGISEDALVLDGDQEKTMGIRSRHGISNIILHNGKYTMLNNYTSNFYVSDNLIDWDVVTITNKNDMDTMGTHMIYNKSSNVYKDKFWTIISVNNVLWMMGSSNECFSRGSSSNQKMEACNYVFYTTNLMDVNYSTDHSTKNSYEITSPMSKARWVNLIFPVSSSAENSDMYKYSPLFTEHRQVYYANGVIFAYNGREIVTTKTLSGNERSRTYPRDNRNYTISGSCYFEGAIYLTISGENKKSQMRTLYAGEYSTNTTASGFPNTVTDITSV